MTLFHRLWADEGGFIVSTELMIIATVLVIGMLVGLVSIRDQIVAELADVAGAISQFDQSFSFSAVTGHAVSTAGAIFDDRIDFCDAAGTQDGATVGVTSPSCVNVNVTVNQENPN